MNMCFSFQGGARSIARTEFVINGPPLGGAFTVSPDNGYALTTKFFLSSPGWADVDLPVTISFGYYDLRSYLICKLLCFEGLKLNFPPNCI
jgi:hypothetical protein